MTEILLDRPGTTGEELKFRRELVGRARDLVPVFARNALDTENARRVAEENITAIDEAGLYNVLKPTRFGGFETSFRTQLEVSREIARGCGSTAWTTTLMNICSFFMGYFPDHAQRDVWQNEPGNRIAGVFAPSGHATKVDGGFRVTGRWGWASGSLHSQWAQVGVPLPNDDGEIVDQGFAAIPMRDLTIEDTWFVAGMRGTGSNTLVVDDVFVPDYRIISVPAAIQGLVPTEHKTEALYRSAFIPAASLVLAGPQLGLAQAALELVLDKAPKRAIAYTSYETQVDSPSFQLSIARASMLIDSAHLHAYRAAADIDDAARAGRFPEYHDRARVRADTGWAVEQAREAIRILVSAHGASSFAEVNPMQRIWRDSETASRHAVVNPSISAELYGQSMLGKTGQVTALV